MKSTELNDLEIFLNSLNTCKKHKAVLEKMQRIKSVSIIMEANRRFFNILINSELLNNLPTYAKDAKMSKEAALETVFLGELAKLLKTRLLN